MNILNQEGQWAWYLGWGGKKFQRGSVQHGYKPARSHSKNMKAEMERLFRRGLSATEYARDPLGARWYMPVYSVRGHAEVAYEWCHLVAHGLQGADTPANIVAATEYQNTEQLILECVLYEYRMEGLTLSVSAKLASGTAHLGESIYYCVVLNGRNAYTRTMDCRRATKPTYDEFGLVAAGMRKSLNTELARQFPAIPGRDDEIMTFIEGEKPEEPVNTLATWIGL